MPEVWEKCTMMKTDFEVPRDVAICPHCGGDLYLEVIEWFIDSGEPTEGGCYVSCVDEDTNEALHERSPYIYMLPVAAKVYEWARNNVCIGPDEDELREKWRAFEAGEPMKGGMRQ
jgi:hypothetical protein